MLHYIGHGYFDDATDVGGLILEDAVGNGEFVTAAKLGELLHDQESLRLVYLNACEGARSGQGDSFAGVAQQLIQQGIPAILAMQFAVSDDAALLLSQEFYHAIADGLPVDSAVAEARKRLSVAGNDLEWGTPVLFSRSDDNRLIELIDAERYTPPLDDEPEMVLIPAGPFWMGASPEDGEAEAWESPAGEIELSTAYMIGRYPITNKEYWAFVKESGHTPPRLNWIGRRPRPDRMEHPVTQVSWEDANAYCEWLAAKTGRTYRLPSEAEWEKAARGDRDQRIYPWGDTWDPTRCNAEGSEITAVCAYPQQSQSGCFDLIGNVREWTNTLWGKNLAETMSDYPYPWQADEREGTAADMEASYCYRIYRGGAVADARSQLRCSARDWNAMNVRDNDCGFRVVMTF
ncbi:MAG: SUMF1/EgtB/PvdO family nonheme iron enzyme [Caldilineaceae bacterium]